MDEIAERRRVQGEVMMLPKRAPSVDVQGAKARGGYGSPSS